MLCVEVCGWFGICHPNSERRNFLLCLQVETSLLFEYDTDPLLAVKIWYFSHRQRLHLFDFGVQGLDRRRTFHFIEYGFGFVF